MNAKISEAVDVMRDVYMTRTQREAFDRIAAAAHLQGEAVPVGCAIVPRQATYEMCEAGSRHLAKYGIATAWKDMVDFYTNNPQPAELNEVSGNSGELGAAEALSKALKSAYEHGANHAPFHMVDCVRKTLAALAATGKQQVGEPKCSDCETPLLYECTGCSATNYPPRQVGEVQGSREQFEAWHIDFCSRSPELECLLGFGDDKKAWAAWKAAIASRQPVGEAVAVVGSDFTICWVGSGPIAPLVERHGINRGTLLYAAPPALGIDLEQLVRLRNDLHAMSKHGVKDGWQDAAVELVSDVTRLIDGRDAGAGVGS